MSFMSFVSFSDVTADLVPEALLLEVLAVPGVQLARHLSFLLHHSTNEFSGVFEGSKLAFNSVHSHPAFFF